MKSRGKRKHAVVGWIANVTELKRVGWLVHTGQMEGTDSSASQRAFQMAQVTLSGTAAVYTLLFNIQKTTVLMTAVRCDRHVVFSMVQMDLMCLYADVSLWLKVLHVDAKTFDWQKYSWSFAVEQKHTSLQCITNISLVKTNDTVFLMHIKVIHQAHFDLLA